MANDQIFIKIKALLEKATDAEIRKVQDEIQRKIKPVKIQVDSTGVAKSVKGVDSLAKSTKLAQESAKGFFNEFTNSISKFAQWLVIGNLIAGSLRRIREGIAFITDLDKDLTEISMITGMTREQTRGLAQEYANLGAEMSKTVVEISAVNKELIRQGLALDVAKERMEAILKLSATARISTTDSLEIITSSVNAMQETADRTSDILLKAGAVSASSAAQIGEAFTKVASSARATGVPIENLTAMIATMIEITQEAPNSLGNSMKTLLARFNKVNSETGELNEDINNVQKAFESVNVTFMDTAGQIRPVNELLQDLSLIWPVLDKNTKSYLATQAAGVAKLPSRIVIYE